MSPKRKQKAKTPPELTSLELTVMHILWKRSNCTAAEVAMTLREKRPLADTTIHTVIGNLREKGYVKLVPSVERSLHFAPIVKREQVADRALTKLIRELFNNSPRLLMTRLIQKENVTQAELDEIQNLLREKR